MYRILLIAYPNYRKYARPILQEAGYLVQPRDPSHYAGLGRKLPDLVIQEGDITKDDTKIVDTNIELTKRIVADINRSGKSISMLVVSGTTGTEDTRLFLRELQKLRGGKSDYLPMSFNSEELLRQVMLTQIS